jgi:hypothetical protein
MAQIVLAGPLATSGAARESTGWLKLQSNSGTSAGSDGSTPAAVSSSRTNSPTGEAGKWKRKWCGFCGDSLCCANNPLHNLEPEVNLSRCRRVGRSTQDNAAKNGELEITCGSSVHTIRVIVAKGLDPAATKKRWGGALTTALLGAICRRALQPLSSGAAANVLPWYDRQLAYLAQAVALSRTDRREMAAALWTAALDEPGYVPPLSLQAVVGWGVVDAVRAAQSAGVEPLDDSGNDGGGSGAGSEAVKRGAHLLARGSGFNIGEEDGSEHDEYHGAAVALEAARAAVGAGETTLATVTLNNVLVRNERCFECLQLLEHIVLSGNVSDSTAETTWPGLAAGRKAYARERASIVIEFIQSPSQHSKPRASASVDSRKDSRDRVDSEEDGSDHKDDVSDAVAARIPTTLRLSRVARDMASALGLDGGLERLTDKGGSALVAVDVKPPGPDPFGPVNPRCFKATMPLSTALRRVASAPWPHYVNIGHAGGVSLLPPYHRPLDVFGEALDPSRKHVEAAMGGAIADHVNLWLGGLGSDGGDGSRGECGGRDRGGSDGGGESDCDIGSATKSLPTRTQRHADQYDNVYVLLRGRKRFVLQPPTTAVETVAPVTRVAANGVHTTATPAADPRLQVEGALFDRVLRGDGLSR